MSTLIFWTILAILVNSNRAYFYDLGRFREAIHVKSIQKTIFYIGFIPYDLNIDDLCVSLLLVKEIKRHCFTLSNHSIKSIEFPISLNGHVSLLFKAYKKSTSLSSYRSNPVFTHSEIYFVTESESESSFNQYHSRQQIEAPASFVRFTYPPYGSLVSNALKLNFSAVDVNTERNAVIYTIYVPGIASFDLLTPINELIPTHIEPASWFISMTPKFNANIESQPLLGYTTETYLGRTLLNLNFLYVE